MEFEISPTEDGNGYWVELCRNGDCHRAFVSSMHLVEDKHLQLERAFNKDG